MSQLKVLVQASLTRTLLALVLVSIPPSLLPIANASRKLRENNDNNVGQQDPAPNHPASRRRGGVVILLRGAHYWRGERAQGRPYDRVSVVKI